MPLRDGIQRFLDGIDPKILARGRDYYRSGQIESIDWDVSHVTAEVSGSDVEPYLVKINFTEDGRIADWTCDCPYDWGDVCKHTAAALLVIQQETEELPPEKKKREKVSIQALVESAEKEQLAALVLEHCQEDIQSIQRTALQAKGEDWNQKLEYFMQVGTLLFTERKYGSDGPSNQCRQ